MYVIIADLVWDKTINLVYPIQNFDLSEEVTVVGLFIDNIQYEFMAPWTIEVESGNKRITAGTYTRRELNKFIKG